MVFCGLYPIDGDQFTDLREALEKLRPQRRQLHLRARDVGGARLRLPLRLPRPAAHGDRPRAARARVRPQPHRHRPVGGLPGPHHTGEVVEVDNPSAMPPAASIERIEEPYLTCTILTPTDYTGTLMELCQTRRGEMTSMEYLSPERARAGLPAAAGRGGARLLRPAEDPHPGLRQPRLRAGRLRAVRPGQGRRAAQRRAGRRLQHDRPPGQGLRLRPAA